MTRPDQRSFPGSFEFLADAGAILTVRPRFFSHPLQAFMIAREVTERGTMGMVATWGMLKPLCLMLMKLRFFPLPLANFEQSPAFQCEWVRWWERDRLARWWRRFFARAFRAEPIGKTGAWDA